MARQALPPSSLSFSDASLFPGSTARERPEDGTSTAHYDALNYRVGPAREKTSAHLLVIRQVILETRTPGQREERKKKKTQEAATAATGAGRKFAFPPSRDEIGPGRIRGASLGMSDWRKAVCAAPEPDSWKKKRRLGDQGCRWAPVDKSRRSSPSGPTPIFFLYSPVLRLWPLSSWNLKFCNSQAKYCRAAGAPSRKTVTLTSSLCASQALFQALSVD